MDRRIAALYDVDNCDGADHDFYRRLADRLGADTIIDLGCGAGLLTVTLARARRTVVGIDPDENMLDIARHRPGAECVSWVLGDSRDIGEARADLVLMTGNVAQHIGPAEWRRTLADIRRGLRAGGVVSFETRNPTAEAWRGWNSATSSTRDTPNGRLTEWTEVTEPDAEGTVVLTATTSGSTATRIRSSCSHSRFEALSRCAPTST